MLRARPGSGAGASIASIDSLSKGRQGSDRVESGRVRKHEGRNMMARISMRIHCESSIVNCDRVLMTGFAMLNY